MINLPRGRRISVRDSESPAPSQTSSVPSDAGNFAGFEEWPLSNVSLKRITEGDKTTFQLQFDWTPDPSQPHADRPVSHSKEGPQGIAFRNQIIQWEMDTGRG
ncbi:hypothetical protein FLAG1_10976 [Fusarium langsethiae]|uniref:Uncharacterized protein n=1 Tax=Fusarium langsethiae TaxID=179993 RepID=A0A0N0DB56_FUSLA|nr:hypothetical protein FLAG1_10976 [Fusarium langsethiae]